MPMYQQSYQRECMYLVKSIQKLTESDQIQNQSRIWMGQFVILFDIACDKIINDTVRIFFSLRFVR